MFQEPPSPVSYSLSIVTIHGWTRSKKVSPHRGTDSVSKFRGLETIEQCRNTDMFLRGENGSNRTDVRYIHFASEMGNLPLPPRLFREIFLSAMEFGGRNECNHRSPLDWQICKRGFPAN